MAFIFLGLRLYVRVTQRQWNLVWSEVWLMAGFSWLLGLVICDTITYEKGAMSEFIDQTDVSIKQVSHGISNDCQPCGRKGGKRQGLSEPLLTIMLLLDPLCIQLPLRRRLVFSEAQHGHYLLPAAPTTQPRPTMGSVLYCGLHRRRLLDCDLCRHVLVRCQCADQLVRLSRTC